MTDTTFQLSFSYNNSNSRTEIWPLDQLPTDDVLVSKPVTQDFINSVTEHGVLTPIWLARLTDHNHDVFVVAGSRRIKAARIAGITEILAVVREMTLHEAMAARSTENNMRSENILADVNAVEYFLALDPRLENQPRTLAGLLGVSLPKIKKLLPMARASMLFKDAVSDGFISEETFRKTSNLPPTYLQMAIQRFAENKTKYLREKANGKVFKSVPILLSTKDLVEFQQVRKETAAQSLPLFASMQEQPATFAANILGQLGIPGEQIEGFIVVYSQDGSEVIQNYSMYGEEDARAILKELAENYPDLQNLRLCKVTKVE